MTDGPIVEGDWSKSALRELVRTQRLALCDQLDLLSRAQFDQPSWCSGWRVRDVVGHLVSIVTLPTWRFAAVTKSGVTRRLDRKARAFGMMDPYELVADYRAKADTIPTLNPLGKWDPLADVVTHSLDISEPLGLDPVVLLDAKIPVLNALAGGMKLFTQAGTKGVRLYSTDLAWNHGDGPEVYGTANDLILALTGRQAVSDRLGGDGVARFLCSNR